MGVVVCELFNELSVNVIFRHKEKPVFYEIQINGNMSGSIVFLSKTNYRYRGHSIA